MASSRIAIALLACLAAMPAAEVRAQAPGAEVIPSYRKRIMGVFDDRSGDAVQDADVVSVLDGVSMKTSSSGAVMLVFLPEGGGLVRIRKVGYEPQTMLVSISPSDTLPITIILKRVTELAAINVVDSGPHYRAPSLQGFEARSRNAASGYFLHEVEIRKEEGRNIGNVLIKNFPNIVIGSGRGGKTFLLQSPRCGKGGPPSVYLDGALQSKSAGDRAVDLTEYPLTSLAGIEYYPTTSAAPPGYGGTSAGCGVLLLWTREQ